MMNTQRRQYGQEILTYDPEESLIRAQIPLKELRVTRLLLKKTAYLH